MSYQRAFACTKLTRKSTHTMPVCKYPRTEMCAYIHTYAHTCRRACSKALPQHSRRGGNEPKRKIESGGATPHLLNIEIHNVDPSCLQMLGDQTLRSKKKICRPHLPSQRNVSGLYKEKCRKLGMQTSGFHPHLCQHMRARSHASTHTLACA
jgi:hypothetical protein